MSSEVGESIAQQQELTTAVPLGAYPEPTGIRTSGSYDAKDMLGDACLDVGVEMAIGVFTGG